MGRFTDPHPLTCSFFTPYLHCLMFRQCGLPLALSKPTLGVEDNFVFHRGHPALPCAAFAGPPRPAFSFLPFFCPFVLPPCVEGLVFSHPGSPVPRIRPQLAHTAPTGPVWGSTGVVPLFGSQNRTQGRTRAFSLFPSTCSTFPLRGKVGLNSHPSCSARPNSSTTAPHGFNGAGNPSYWCRFPNRPTKPHTGPHRAEFGFHRLFLVRFGSGRVDKSFSSL